MALGPEKLSGLSRNGPQSVHSSNKFSVSVGYGLLQRRMSRMCKRGRKKRGNIVCLQSRMFLLSFLHNFFYVKNLKNSVSLSLTLKATCRVF